MARKIASFSSGPSPKKMPWTAQEDFVLRMLAGNVPIRDIAAQLGRTRHAVDCRLRLIMDIHVGREAREARVRAQEARLAASAEDLAEYCLSTDEDPVEPIRTSQIWAQKRTDIKYGVQG